MDDTFYPHGDEGPVGASQACEPMAAYQSAPRVGSGVFSPKVNTTDRDTQNRMTYFVYCVNAFAERYQLSPKQAFAYLHRYKGMDFLDECYEAEHQLSIRDAVDDLTIICKRNGGKLV